MTSKNIPPQQPDAEYIQAKIGLIERGLPVDISESELATLEDMLRGARSFYIDILQSFNIRKEAGEEVEHHIAEESKNLVGVEMALRKIDDFRKEHGSKIS